MNQLKRLITTIFGSKTKLWSAINILIISIFIVTPLCGFLFQCGCDWPWSGLDIHCNYYVSKTDHQCPWCVSMALSVLLLGIAFTAGLFISTTPLPLSNGTTTIQVMARTIAGLLTFILIATISASLMTFIDDYPLGIGKYFHPPLIL